MNSNKKGEAINADREQVAIHRIEEMWDRTLAKGDDEFFDSATKHKTSDSNNKERHPHPQQHRRRGRRM